MKQALGRVGECIASSFLVSKGYTLLHKNWRYGNKEVDIIAYDDGVLVFIEVKTRRNSNSIIPSELFSSRKCKHYIECVYGYQSLYKAFNAVFRFDLICIHKESSKVTISHWRDVGDVRETMDSWNTYW